MTKKNLTKENRKLHEKLDPRYKKVYEDILIYTGEYQLRKP
ncbi:hypothetical protein [Salinicoccus roseus]|nr:hypothetical protein [Salinicoccus roseus]